MESIINLMGHDLRLDNIVKATNCTLVDSHGNHYLDLESGVWCTSIGHSNKAVTKVLSKCSKSFMHSGYCYNSQYVNEAARKILEISGINAGKCVFLCSGSEAVDLSITISQHITNRQKILTLSDSYLSAFGHFSNKDEVVTYNWLDSTTVNDIDYNQIAAFAFEPGSSSGLVRFPPKEVIHNIVDNVKKAGGLIIANEVTTGIGRTGAWYGFNHYELRPDIIASGKGLGNGYPISCVALTEKVASQIDLQHFHYGQSHQNDPLGARVAFCVLNEIQNKDLLKKANRINELIVNGIEGIKAKYGIIKEVRSRGLMFAVEFKPVTQRVISQEIADELFKNRIIVVKRPNNEVIRFDPALTIREKEVNYFLRIFEKIIEEIRLTTAST
jgi:acetylornithine aminotransferase